MNSIDALKSDKTVAPSDEIRGESCREVLALQREIAQCSQMVACGGLTSDRDCVRVLKSEWREPADVIELCESSRDVCEHPTRIRRDRIWKRVVENRD